jgi:hypothetical protein
MAVLRSFAADSECTGKRQYRQKDRAKRDARLARNGPAGNVRPYRCSHCGWWHLGHKPYDARKAES